MGFKERLKELRESRGLTQEQFADASGLNRSTVGMYEQGRREPDFETEEIIADFFNVDLEYLRGRESHSTYYLDPETAALAEDIHKDPKRKYLLSASRKLTPAQLKAIIATVDSMVATEEGED